MIIEKEDAFEIMVAGLVVTASTSDSSYSKLELTSPTATWSLVIEGAFSVKRENSSNDGLESTTIGELVGKSVLALRVLKTGAQLEASFAHGWRLTVFSDEHYEAWEMHSSNGVRLVAVPGDGVAFWSAEPA